MNSDQQSVVTIRNLKHRWGERVVFDGVDLDIPKGKITAIMGPSGTGKTTLLHVIGGLVIPDEGQVHVLGQNVCSLPRRELYKLRRSVGMLFQNGALFTDMSVFDNVAFALREHTNLSEALIHTVVLMKLQSVGLRGAKDLMPSQLSGGMARRVALARATAFDPPIMMYDEPFTGQDPISMGVLVKLIRSLNDALEMTSVIVSHDVDEAASIADYIYLLADGQVIGQGSPDMLMQQDNPRVRQFLQGLPDGPVPFHYPAHDYLSDLLSESAHD